MNFALLRGVDCLNDTIIIQSPSPSKPRDSQSHLVIHLQLTDDQNNQFVLVMNPLIVAVQGSRACQLWSTRANIAKPKKFQSHRLEPAQHVLINLLPVVKQRVLI